MKERTQHNESMFQNVVHFLSHQFFQANMIFHNHVEYIPDYPYNIIFIVMKTSEYNLPQRLHKKGKGYKPIGPCY